ncbi:hypothetical protein [Marinicrinis sediminis]|uniref:Uncharacterized protein n=1 Tax=Marinicrinis sediminis TaxID=1652465 RepID=A0ABW5RDA5_9BACL
MSDRPLRKLDVCISTLCLAMEKRLSSQKSLQVALIRMYQASRPIPADRAQSECIRTMKLTLHLLGTLLFHMEKISLIYRLAGAKTENIALARSMKTSLEQTEKQYALIPELKLNLSQMRALFYIQVLSDVPVKAPPNGRGQRVWLHGQSKRIGPDQNRYSN